MSKKSPEQNSGQARPPEGLTPALQLIVWIALIVTFTIGLLDVAGWIFNISAFKSIMPTWEPMKKITAACFVFASIALVIINLNLTSFLRKVLPGILAGVICLVSLTTIYVYNYSIKTGLESSLTGVPFFAFFLAPSTRMALLTAFNFFLISCILLLLSGGKKTASAIAHILIIPVSFVSYFVIISYILGVYTMIDLKNVSVALNSGIAFSGLCVAILFMRPDTWLLEVFTSQDTGGIFARRLLPGLMILPIVIGWFRIKGEHEGLFISEEGVTLVAIAYTACFLTLILLIAKSVNKIDTKRRASEEALLKSEGQFRILFEGMNEGFALHEIILDEKGIPCDYRFLSINPAFEKQTGLLARNIIGKRVLEVMPETEKFWIETYGKVALTGESVEFENFLAELNSYFRVSAFCPKSGYFAVILENITRHRLADNELKRTKNYLENLIDYANAPIIVWNTKTEIQLFNHAFEYLTGYSSEEVRGKKLELLFPQISLKEANEKIKESLTKNWRTIEIPILTKNKRIRTVLWNSANIYDTDNKTILSTIAQGNDITERKRAEQKVKKRTRELEIANARLNRELRDRIIAEQALIKSEDKLKELNATKDKFFNILAHDLKNPFTSLIGSSELLYHNINKMDKEQIRNLAQILNDTSKSGYSILQNLLDWSRSQAGLLTINPEKINLRDLINENILNLEHISANKEIRIHSKLDQDIIISADKNMIKTILRNLLSNAVKYSYRNGNVYVNAVNEDDKVIIAVQDSGIGIPQESIEKIFRIDAKYSLPGTENEYGTGLGLKLCKEFVEKQGGNIWVESTENKGSEFKFSIPLRFPVMES